MNPDLDLLQPYPFERLRRLFEATPPSQTGRDTVSDVAADVTVSEIKLSIGEPQHATPNFIKTALADNLAGLAIYPTTQGSEALRAAITHWISRRYSVPVPDLATQVLPVNGSREALFSFAQTVIDRSRTKIGAAPRVVCPNPFYQIYEGAALLAGGLPLYLNTLPQNNYVMDWSTIPDATWRTVQLVYVCTPGNPTGKVMSQSSWQSLFELSDRYGFVIASDECYSEIYPVEGSPPLGGLTAAAASGRPDYRNLLIFSSLSKRSNVPGMRSGFVAGDAALIKKFLLYRTYHGSAMSPAIQAASSAAWNDEAHVKENRRLYAKKFSVITPLIARHLECSEPDAGFYLWAKTPISDTDFAQALYHQTRVVVLPGSFLARDADGINPGAGYIRIALVPNLDECRAAAQRIDKFCSTL